MNGRPEGINEHNDCVIRAISLAYGVDYVDVWRIAKKYKRRERCGTPWRVLVSIMEDARALAPSGIVVAQVYMDGRPTLDTFTRHRQEGVYLVKIRGHLMALIDGKRMDPVDDKRGRWHVYDAWVVR